MEAPFRHWSRRTIAVKLEDGVASTVADLWRGLGIQGAARYVCIQLCLRYSSMFCLTFLRSIFDFSVIGAHHVTADDEIM